MPESLKEMSKKKNLILGGQVITNLKATLILAGHLSGGFWGASLDGGQGAGNSHW